MRYLLLTAAGLAAAGPACAQNITVKPVAEARVRYEHVDQQGLANPQSDGVTARVRGGFTAATGPFTVTAIGQGNLAIVDHYYDGLEGAATRPLIADPQNIALYVAQLQYKSKFVTVTGGRQRILLDDERFVGNVAFRDNAQTFDAVRAEVTPAKALKIDLAYAWDVRTIWGIDGNGARQQAIGGDNVFANVSYATKLGTLTGFGYFVDQNEAVVQGYRLSSRTLGGRFAGSRPLSKTAKLSYTLSYAQQQDLHNNPNDYSASYWLGELTLDVKAWKLNAGYEELGASGGAPFTSFQTPLGTNFKFQGWADKFLTTPGNGVRDYYAGASYGWKKLGKIDTLTLQGVYHRFESDMLSQHYGDEVDLLATAKIKKYTVALRYAHYDAAAFATDTDKIWLQVDWAF